MKKKYMRADDFFPNPQKTTIIEDVRKTIQEDKERGCDARNLMSLTTDEQNVMNSIVDAWHGYIRLESQHPDDIHEFRHAIHRLQHLLMIRHIRREFPDTYPSYPNG